MLDALTPLCKQLKLRDRSSRDQVHWHLELLHLELWIDVTAVADGERTLVGVQIRPVRGTFVEPPDNDLRGPLFSVGVLCVVAMFIVKGELWVAVIFFFVLLLPPLLVLVLGSPLERARRAKTAWASDWRRDFWTALHGRVAPRALYR
ncbi:hypothetical protein [Nannocystis pusilla]|uniref:hypothetical protein n=1 Tax=Nannocystis pusilla TaxID=889268 RepID=UPI003DA6A159